MTEQPAPRAWPRRAALTLVAAVTAASYAWAINRDPLEGYYAAAVRSMSMSWHDFIFGAFDPAGTVTLDKLPGAFWIQALAVRALGLHTWVIVAPQAVEGVLTVLVLYRAVRRLAGPTAGLIAAIVFAVSPATVALNRGNISDTLMILLLVLAADAASAAITSSRPGGSQGQLILAGVWVGLAFQAKMIEAWLLLPALGLAFLIAAPGRAVRRLRQLAVAAVVTGVVSLAWITAFSLVPAAHRPYADGSHDNSVYQQVFVYNGFGRLGDQTPLQLLAGQGISLQRVAPGQAPAPDRLLRGGLGRDSGWLLPAALAVAGWGLLARRRAPRGDPLRAGLVLWGGWLLTLAVTFSVTTTLNAYYTAALTPAVAAILGAGLAAAWSARRPAASLLAGLAVVAAGTAGYAAWLLSTGTGVPGWVVPAVLAAGLAAVAAAATALVRGRPGPGSAGASGAARRDRVLAAALGTGLVAALLGPAVAAASIVGQDRGAFDTPYEPAAEAAAVQLLFVQLPEQVRPLLPQLEKAQFGAPDLLAAQSSALAAVFIYDSGQEALPLGGFTGTIPSPTLARVQADVRMGQFHLVIVPARAHRGPVLRWIVAHCRPVPGIDPALRTFFCLPPDAG
jgi:4-amino-4-deoxy-L-arabinose transferase-like glycosyltransferase